MGGKTSGPGGSVPSEAPGGSVTWASIAWQNGDLVPLESLRLSAFSFAALYGFGLFETVRAYDGVPFALDRHAARMAAGAQTLGLDCGWLRPEAVREGVGRVLEANSLPNAVVRLTLTATGQEWEDLLPTLTISVRAFAGYPARWYEEGVDLVVAPWRRCPEDPVVGLKSANYLTCLRAREFARRAGGDEALLLNCRGRAVEGSVSNLFVVSAEGQLVTPPAEDGLLPGVTRALVLELAAQNGLATREQSVSLTEVQAAAEAFVTNSLMEIAPVRRIGGEALPQGPGAMTRLLSRAYRRAVSEATTGTEPSA